MVTKTVEQNRDAFEVAGIRSKILHFGRKFLCSLDLALEATGGNFGLAMNTRGLSLGLKGFLSRLSGLAFPLIGLRVGFRVEGERAGLLSKRVHLSGKLLR